jgi:hypothetical protein
MYRKSIVCAALFLATSSISQALTLDCEIKPNSDSFGYVTERYVLQYDETTGQAYASDALILYFNEQPVAAKVSEDTKKKLVLTWDLQFTNSTGQMTRMLFRAAYFRANGSVIVRATPSGYTNQFEARGRCTKV